MKRKFLCLGLSAMLIGSMVTGCGSKTEVESTETNTQTEINSEETSTEKDTETTTEEPTTEEKNEFDNIDETGTVRENVSYTLEDLKNVILTDNFQLSTTTNGLNIIIARSGNNVRMSMGCEYEGVDILFDMYAIDNEIYSSMTDEEGNIGYYHASSNAEEVTGMISEDTFEVDFDSIKSVEYVTTKRYEGKVYDVIKVGTSTYELNEDVELEINGEKVDEEELTYTEYYINVETKMIEYVMMDDETTGEKTVGKYELITKIELPSEFTSKEVEEVEAEDIASQMLGMMFLQFATMGEIE